VFNIGREARIACALPEDDCAEMDEVDIKSNIPMVERPDADVIDCAGQAMVRVWRSV
jgi:hypothetical protein